MSAEKNTDNRRDFYRIKDQGMVSYRLYDNDPPDFSQFFRHQAYFELMNDIQAMDIEFHRLLSYIPEHERTTAALIKLMNKKVDMLARTVTLVESDIPENGFQLVDISEGGLSFGADKPMQTGQRMALKFTILPSYLSVATLAEVVSCDISEDNTTDSSLPNHPHRIRVNFIDLDEHQRQLIARHILRTQQQARREQLAKD